MFEQYKSERLVRNLSKACGGYGLDCVYAALVQSIQGVLEQVPQTSTRNYLALQLTRIVLLAESFDHIRQHEPEKGSDAIAEIESSDARVLALLAYIKALIIVSAPVPEHPESRGWLKLLRRRYVVVKRPDECFTPKDLYDLLALAARIIQTHSKDNGRIQIIVATIQAFISMSDFDDIKISQLKKILQAVATIPNEEFREGASLKRIEAIVNDVTRSVARPDGNRV